MQKTNEKNSETENDKPRRDKTGVYSFPKAVKQRRKWQDGWKAKYRRRRVRRKHEADRGYKRTRAWGKNENIKRRIQPDTHPWLWKLWSEVKECPLCWGWRRRPAEKVCKWCRNKLAAEEEERKRRAAMSKPVSAEYRMRCDYCGHHRRVSGHEMCAKCEQARFYGRTKANDAI